MVTHTNAQPNRVHNIPLHSHACGTSVLMMVFQWILCKLYGICILCLSIYNECANELGTRYENTLVYEYEYVTRSYIDVVFGKLAQVNAVALMPHSIMSWI